MVTLATAMKIRSKEFFKISRQLEKQHQQAFTLSNLPTLTQNSADRDVEGQYNPFLCFSQTQLFAIEHPPNHWECLPVVLWLRVYLGTQPSHISTDINLYNRQDCN